MSEVLRERSRGSISGLEIDFQVGKQKRFFGELAEFLWPDTKPDFELQIRTGATDRMCRYWIEGKHPPNARAVRALLGEILKRLG